MLSLIVLPSASLSTLTFLQEGGASLDSAISFNCCILYRRSLPLCSDLLSLLLLILDLVPAFQLLSTSPCALPSRRHPRARAGTRCRHRHRIAIELQWYKCDTDRYSSRLRRGSPPWSPSRMCRPNWRAAMGFGALLRLDLAAVCRKDCQTKGHQPAYYRRQGILRATPSSSARK